MRPIHDRPIDRAARKAITICIIAGVVVGAIFGVPRYGAISIGTTGFMGLGVMIALGGYAAVVALLPSTIREESDVDVPPP